jgi:nitrite reductase (NO-forming)
VIAVILTYLAAALVVAVAPQLVATPRWLALHLLFLGAATNAIVIYTAHFAETLLHARPAGAGWVRVQLFGLNVGVLSVLTGVDSHYRAPIVIGAALVAAAVLAGAARLIQLARHSLAGRLRATVWFYVAGAGFLAAGATSGALLGAAGVGMGSAYLVTFHAHANLFGWVGLTVLGTLFMLWPAALRTRMAPDAPRVARRVLTICVAGLSLAAAALLAAHPGVAAVGMAGYTAGVVLFLDPFIRAARQRWPHDMASWSLAAATGWLLASLLWDITALATAGPHVDRIADRLAPLLAVGLVAQVLVGALSFLLPVLLGGGPAAGKRMSATLNRAWPARLALTNLGAALTLLPPAGATHTAGYLAVLAGLGSFLPLALIAAATGMRSTGRRAAAAKPLRHSDADPTRPAP